MNISVGMKVCNSPAGAGVIEKFESGFPVVNGQPCAVLFLEGNHAFNPLGLDLQAVVKQWREVDKMIDKT